MASEQRVELEASPLIQAHTCCTIERHTERTQQQSHGPALSPTWIASLKRCLVIITSCVDYLDSRGLRMALERQVEVEASPMT